MNHIADAVAAFFLGAIFLAPVAALSARFAMKPLVSLFSRRLATLDLAAQVSEQSRRIEVLEGELAAVHESVKTMAAAAEFQRQLSAPEGSTPSKATPAS